MDIWRLEDSISVQLGLPGTIEELLGVLPHNLDRIAFDLKSGKVVDLGCLDGIINGVIEYGTPIEGHDLSFVYRSFVIQMKTGFEFGQSTLDLVGRARELIKEDPRRWNGIEAALKRKYPRLTKKVRRALLEDVPLK